MLTIIIEGQVIHAPIITTELRSQAKEWYKHLPPAIRFPLDTSPLYDLRKAALRAEYYGVFILINWPCVLRVLELGETEVKRPDRLPEASALMKQAQECISNCVLLLATAEECLSRTNMGAQIVSTHSSV
jgi:hypothetical protein